MRAPNRTCSHSRTPCIAQTIVLIAALLVRNCAATLPTPPSSADKWLYPDVNTLCTYNYLDTVNASWTSKFVAPYLRSGANILTTPSTMLIVAYNDSVSATGSALVPLDDGNAWVCHFEVSDLSTFGATPPTFVSNDFNIVLDDGKKPVLWTNSQDGGENATSRAIPSSTTASPMTSSNSTSSTTTSLGHVPLSSAAPTSATAPTTSSTIASSSAIIPTPTQSSTSPTHKPSNKTSGLSKSKKVATIVGSTMGALFLLVIAIAALFILRTRRPERNAVVYRIGLGGEYGSKEVPGSEAPRERWKGPDIPSGRMQGYF